MRLMPPVYDHIRKAIAASNKSRYRMAKETGISEPHLCQFMAGTKGLSVEALERLADCLGLEIITNPKNNNRGKR
ncbi:MAG: helix-turn-helix transcriptional regulator [Phycisphaeraceae bacterium]|nr:helix-turn-helix transcriptional regulator [Phycisphaeraceae bacterium]